MIEKMQVQNFQRHDRLRVQFDSRVTTVVGPSDSGKSSLLRAIRWVAFNRPLGDGFVRHGEKGCSVKLWVDGNRIERKKVAGKNCYVVNGKQLNAVKTDVPEEVSKLLNVGAENFQGQHDAPFWFSLTPGEVAKRLNAVVDLEVIDQAASWLASRLRRARTEKQVTEDRLQEAKQERESLDHVPDVASDLDGLKRTCRKLDESRDRLDRLSQMAGKVRRSSRLASDATRAADEGTEVVRRSEALERKLEDLESIRLIVSRARRAASEASELESAWRRADKELGRQTGGLCPLCGGKMR